MISGYDINKLRTARNTLHKLEHSIEPWLTMERIHAIRIAEFAIDEILKLQEQIELHRLTEEISGDITTDFNSLYPNILDSPE